MAGAALGAGPRKSSEQVMTLSAASFGVAGAALGAPPACFAWQAQHLEHLRPVLRGRRIGAPRSLRLVLRGRLSTWSTSGLFCVAGAALGAPQARFAWQVQHWKHLICVLRCISLEPKPMVCSLVSSQTCREHRQWVLKSG